MNNTNNMKMGIKMRINRRTIKRGIPFKDRKRRCRVMVLKRQAEESPFK